MAKHFKSLSCKVVMMSLMVKPIVFKNIAVWVSEINYIIISSL